MTLLSVNLNKIALLRNSRGHDRPSVTDAARVCVARGAGGITVHPRPDQRHIRPHDVTDLAAMLEVEFNIEGNPYPEFMDLVAKVRPTQATLVPDDPGQLTSDHGWDLAADGARVEGIARTLRDRGVRVSLFMDPDPGQIRRARDVGADRVELYTESWAVAHGTPEEDAVFARFAEAAACAREAGLGINAGHDLDLHNLGRFCAQIPGVLEVSIGHALIVDALEMGLVAAVDAYLAVLRDARSAA